MNMHLFHYAALFKQQQKSGIARGPLSSYYPSLFYMSDKCFLHLSTLDLTAKEEEKVSSSPPSQQNGSEHKTSWDK
jgi:hypothetical protein